jgi:hypothetical protein
LPPASSLPIATAILVLLTLFGALPIYRRVAYKSPNGEGSIAMLRTLLSWWQGKLFILVLLGFVATDFIITITLSAADATAHIAENPFVPHVIGEQRGLVTLLLIALLGAVFLKGFGEAISVAVVLVTIYLTLNATVIGDALFTLLREPGHAVDWERALFAQHGNPLRMVAAAAIVFPRLALGLSGFETGVAVMPLVKGGERDNSDHPVGRIANTRKLLTSAALIMSAFLLTSSIVTSTLIPHAALEPGGPAYGRALAYLAHTHLGEVFGTVYDISTILILWFAGASAMAGLLNIVPRYLPRYGMAPSWTLATRPLVLIFTATAFLVTLIFHADVEAQGGAYATGVLVLITSASVAVTLAAKSEGSRLGVVGFGAITLVFLYTTVLNVFERPDGVKIASCFIGAIIITSIISRVKRSTELRVKHVVVDDLARRFVAETAHRGVVRIAANQPDERSWREYLLKEWQERNDHHIPRGEPLLFLEVTPTDASEFEHTLRVTAEDVAGYHVLRASAPSVPHAIAAFLLWVRDHTGQVPHVYFDWTEGNPLHHLARFLLFGTGDIPPVTREILRIAEPDPSDRPVVHVS